MALSTPPPPPDANPSTTSSSSTTTTTTHPTRLPFPANPRPHPHPHPPHHYPAAPFYPPHPHHPNLVNPRLPSNPNPNYPHISPAPHPLDLTTAASTATLYPVASSGRGFLSKQPPAVAVNNSNPNSHLYQARPGGVSYPRPVFGYSHSDPGQVPGMGYGYGRATTHLQHPGAVLAASIGGSGGATAMPGVIKGVPVSGASSLSQHKIALSSTAISDCNGHKEIRERSRDDSVVTVRDRKVRVSDNASLYALCRSWLKNGFPEESQPVHMDAVRSLPRPLPLPAQDSISPLKKEDAKEEEFQEEGSVENLTPEELLQMHVKRAKKVRSRLREERLQRIARYKTRLALLLPPMVEQQLRNDSASGI